MRVATVVELEAMLWTRTDLAQHGWGRAGIDGAVSSGELHRLRRGWYMRGADWGDLWPQARHLAQILAAQHDSHEPPVFARESAAVLLGLPVLRVPVDRVHIHAGPSRHCTEGVLRHSGPLEPDDIVEVDGILCTSLIRTIADVVRLASPEAAIACADAAMARVAGGPREYDADAAAGWREHVEARLRVGQRGVRQARAVLSMADGRSELPLESVTKLQLRRLGFAQPSLQVPVPSPAGCTYWMDMELVDADVFYECDGEAKYTDASLRAGRSAEQVVLEEKRREDWVRGLTGKRVIRGGFADVVSPSVLAERLRAFGIPLPPRRDRLLLPSAPSRAAR